MESKVKFEGGKIVATLSDGVDSDKDGVRSAEADLTVRIDLAESINEAFKTDPEWLKGVLGNLGL